MKINKIFSVLCASILLFNIGCRSNDDHNDLESVKYANGILITNEGVFTTPTASVSFSTNDLTLQQNDIFKKNNNNANLGDVLQNMGFYGSNAYMVLNNSNKVTVVDRGTFQLQGEITQNVTQPRYLAFANDNLYVTNSSAVSIFNAVTLQFIKKIDLADTAERIVSAGPNLFVQNAAYGFGTKLTYIDSRTNNIKGSVTVPNGQIQKTITDGNNVYVLASDSTLPDSYIYTISSAGSITGTTTLTGISQARNFALDGGNYYFTSGTKIYKMSVGATSTPSTPLVTATESAPYSGLYGFDVFDGKIFTADANGFTAASTVTVYDSNSGAKVKSFDAGIGTNGFYKN